MTQDHVIDVRAVRRTFGSGASAFTALDSVSVGIRENEFFTLLGPSGCGKTTLLRLIAGFDFPTDGSVLLQGRDIALLPPFKRPVNTVFQSYALFPHMTAAQNIGFGLKMQDWPKAKIAARVDEMLRLVRLEALAGRRASEMSGGQQQRVALARALAPQPKVLLLDEPLSALDYKLRKDMQIELKRLQLDTGITFIFVTHDQEEALTMSDRIAVMSKGRILQVGTPRQIYDQPADRFVAGFIGESNLLPAVLTSAEGDNAVLRLAGGESLSAGGAAGFAPGAQVAVMVRPEHAALVPAGQSGSPAGTLAEVVYFGTDTHFHVRLDDGSRFVLRRQNSRLGAALPQTGDRVGIAIEDGAARVLADAP